MKENKSSKLNKYFANEVLIGPARSLENDSTWQWLKESEVYGV